MAWADDRSNQILVSLLLDKGMKSCEVAEVLGRTAPEVSNASNRAVDNGLLGKIPRLHRERLVDGELEAAVDAIVGFALCGELRKLAKAKGVQAFSLDVFPPWRDHADLTLPSVAVQHVRDFAASCATRVYALLAHASTVGSTWGLTVGEVAMAVSCCTAKSDVPLSCQFVFPMAGEMCESIEYSATRTARELRLKLCRGGSSPECSLAALPAVIPAELRTAWPTLAQFLALSSAYPKIFGPGGAGLADLMDGALTSLGTCELTYTGTDEKRTKTFHSRILRALVEVAGVDSRAIVDTLVGDLAGVLLTRADATDQQIQVAQRWQELWTGVTPAQLRRCALAARDAGPPGVLVVACGDKGATVIAAVAAGLVNHLLIDRSCARSMARRLEVNSPLFPPESS